MFILLENLECESCQQPAQVLCLYASDDETVSSILCYECALTSDLIHVCADCGSFCDASTNNINGLYYCTLCANEHLNINIQLHLDGVLRTYKTYGNEREAKFSSYVFDAICRPEQVEETIKILKGMRVAFLPE